MKILVINSGSSSIKYQLFEMETHDVLAHGNLEKIGEAEGLHSYGLHSGKNAILNDPISDHKSGMAEIVSLLTDRDNGVIQVRSEIQAVGHRVVHGGESFQTPAVITTEVLAAIKKHTPLAPLHNPANIVGIEVSQHFFPDATQVAVFDTAFHHTIPAKAYLYALPYELYKAYGIRRYGFHGTSHQYVAQEAAKKLNKALDELNLITIHLGNGGSITAIEKGKSIDTSMGMTPLEGLIMGTRSGDIDPAIPFFLSQNADMTIQEIDALLNKLSGLKGICGLNDMRDITRAINDGNELAKTALEMYVYRIRKYIGSYIAILSGVDALVFTAGIGEHSSIIREKICQDMAHLSVKFDLESNRSDNTETREIQSADSKVKLLVVPTNEELKIAEETMALTLNFVR